MEVEAFSATEVFGHHVIVAQAATLENKTVPPAFTTTLKQQAQFSLDKKLDIADWFYIPSWKRSPLPKTSQLGVAQLGCSLVFVDECGIGSELVKQLALVGQDVVTIKLGKRFNKNSEAGQHLYTINPQNRDDYDALLNELRTLGLIPKRIAHLWSITPPSYSDSRLDNYEKAQEQGLYSLILLVQAIGKQNLTNELEIVVISNGMQALTGEEMLNPEKATLLGAVKVIPREYPNIRCRSIDIVLPASGSWKEEKLIEQLLNETSANTSDEIIAHRGVHRWVQTFESVRLDKDVKEIPRLKQGGVYLISGGLGYLGLELLAPHLAKTFQAKLILIGRSAFPLRQDWTEWLATHDDNDDISRKIRKVQELEKLGSEVLVASADVANLQQMQELIAQAQGQFGQINGVIHTAGILGDSSIQRKTIDQIKSVLEAKVKGTLVLDILFKDAELDFLILCSSMAAIAPLPGQVAYTGANNFIDSFAHYKTSIDKQFTVSINLYGWQEGGMGFEGTKHIQKIFQAQSKAVSHPLIDSCLIKDSNQEIYISHLSSIKHWVLNEHKLMGKATLPGTAYLELAVAACENHTQNRTIELREVTFFKPLVVEEHTEKEVRTLLNKQEYGFEFVIISRVESTIEQWTEHARGEIVWTQPESPKKYAISEILDNCHQQEIIVSELNYQTQSKNLEFGLRWQNLQQINFGNNQGLALLELSRSFIDDLNNYKLHPALLDAATGFLSRQLSNKNHYLPFSYKRLTIHNSIASRVYSYARLVEKNNSEQDTLSFNISILDIEGNELVEIEEYTLKKINPEIEQSQVSREIIPAISESENFQLRIFSPGVLETLKFQPTTRKKPKPSEVEIEVAAVGLNFQEVLVAMGLFPTPTNFVYEFGLECAGKIVSLGEGVNGFEIGDEVIAIGSSSLSRFMTTTANLVALKPKHLTLEEAATIPVAFGTAYYSLMKVGRLCKGESILIHSAAGGVGMAAVEIAQWVGAEIFATAGNAEKREFLRSKGIKHVMDSRSVAFADEVMRLTDGKGVNVVLNSLGGEFIPKSLAILARNGRFLEIGQKDILNNTQLGLRPFEKNLSFFAIHPDMEDFKHIDWCKEVVEFFEEGNFPNLPHRVFPITKVADAFEYMAGGKHIGKIVVSLQERDSLKTLVYKESKVELTARKTAAFLATPDSNSVDLLPLNNKLNTDFFREDGLSPSETIEIFSRILGSTLPQVLIWTNDFLSWRERHNTYNQENLIEIFEKANLPQPVQQTYSRPKLKNEYVAPKNEIEQAIAKVWQEVLGINEVGRYDNFFDLGGDSLLIVQVRSKLQKRLNINFSINDAFEYSTITALAQYLSKDQTQESVSQPINERAEKLQKAIAQDAQLIEKRRKARE
ncbi:SDR family oxidoreductase [Nostoc sp.]|uniref:SDR family oxidoreductase n=1 Tax=Nostoc sp. TaxID=1180 RepID=UPI003FA60E4C